MNRANKFPMLSEDKRRLEKLQSDINTFVNSLISDKKYDVIVPIIRKGFFIVASTQSFPLDKIRLPPLYGIQEISSKSFLLIDDKAENGETMQKAYEELLRLGANPGNVSRAVFVKHSNCNSKIDFHSRMLGDADYGRLEADMSMLYDSLCMQLDPNHPSLKIQLTSGTLDPFAFGEFPKALEDCTKDLGLFYLEDSVAELWGRKKFGLADIQLSLLEVGKTSSLIETEGVQKLRFFLEPSGELYIMPMFYPSIDSKHCAEVFAEGISEKIDPTVERNDLLCRQLIDFEVQTQALVKLLPILQNRLKKSGFSFRILELRWPELEYMYENFKTIFADLLATIQRNSSNVLP